MPATAAKVTANMLGGEVLDAAQSILTATYRVRSSVALPKQQPSDPQAYQLDGDFTLHGITRPLRIDAVAEEVGGLVHLRGQFSVRQTQFLESITPYSKAFSAPWVWRMSLKIWGRPVADRSPSLNRNAVPPARLRASCVAMTAAKPAHRRPGKPAATSNAIDSSR